MFDLRVSTCTAQRRRACTYCPGLASRLAVLIFAALVFGIACTPKPSLPSRPAYLPPEDLVAPLLEIATLEDQRAPVGDPLLAYVSNEHPRVRSRVAQALGRLASPAGIAPLGVLASDHDPGVRAAAYFALGQISHHGFVPGSAQSAEGILLERFDQEVDPGLKTVIVKSLGKTADGASRDVFFAALEDPNPELSGEAALAIAIQSYRELASHTDPEIIGRLVALLKSPEEDVRWKAAYAFVRVPVPDEARPQVRKALEQALSDNSSTVRMFVARALGRVGDKATIARLAEAMGSDDWRVRVNCLDAASKLGGDGALLLIQAGLDDPHRMVVLKAVIALGELGEPLGAQLLLPFLQGAEHDPEMAAAAITAHALIFGEEAFDFLNTNARSATLWTRMAATKALGKLKDPRAVDELVQLAYRENDPRVMAVLADALGAYPVELTEGALLVLLQRGDAAVATVAAKTIGRHRIQRALPYLFEAFSHQSPLRDWEPREAIVRAIGLLGQQNDLIRDLLRQAGTDTDPRVARAAAEAYRALFHLELAISPHRPRQLLTSYFEIGRYQKAIIETEKGDIVLALYPDLAPLTTDNFVRLAREGFFTGLTFHRLVPNFVAQSGCPRGDGWGGPGYTIRCEVNPMPYRRGTVGMALSGRDTGGSQFFVTYSPEPHLDGTYTVFGQVIEGMEVVDELRRGDVILKIRVPEEEQNPERGE